MVTWGKWYIYEGFLIWIIPSTSQSHEFKVWAYTINFVHTYIYHFTWCLRSCLSVHMLTTRFLTYAFQLNLPIHVCLLVHATWIYLMYSLGSFMTTLNLHVQILKFRACGFSLLLLRVAQQKRGLSVDCSELFPSSPSCSAPEFPCYSSWAPIVLFIIVYLLVIHSFALLGDVIFI